MGRRGLVNCFSVLVVISFLWPLGAVGEEGESDGTNGASSTLGWPPLPGASRADDDQSLPFPPPFPGDGNSASHPHHHRHPPHRGFSSSEGSDDSRLHGRRLPPYRPYSDSEGSSGSFPRHHHHHHHRISSSDSSDDSSGSGRPMHHLHRRGAESSRDDSSSSLGIGARRQHYHYHFRFASALPIESVQLKREELKTALIAALRIPRSALSGLTLRAGSTVVQGQIAAPRAGLSSHFQSALVSAVSSGASDQGSASSSNALSSFRVMSTSVTVEESSTAHDSSDGSGTSSGSMGSESHGATAANRHSAKETGKSATAQTKRTALIVMCVLCGGATVLAIVVGLLVYRRQQREREYRRRRAAQRAASSVEESHPRAHTITTPSKTSGRIAAEDDFCSINKDFQRVGAQENQSPLDLEMDDDPPTEVTRSCTRTGSAKAA